MARPKTRDERRLILLNWIEWIAVWSCIATIPVAVWLFVTFA